MSVRPFALLLIGCVLAGPAAAQDDPKPAVPLSNQGDQSTDNEMPAIEADGVALASLIAIDTHEIAAAEIARRKQPSQPIADYAKALFDEHTAHRARSEEILRSIGAERPDETALRAFVEGKEALRESLDDLEGEEFESAWLQAMLADHRSAVATVDRLLLSARNDDVVAHLRAMRGHYATHLERARMLAAEADY